MPSGWPPITSGRSPQAQGLSLQDRDDVPVMVARQLGDPLLDQVAFQAVPAAEPAAADAGRSRRFDGFHAVARDRQQPAVLPVDDRDQVAGAAL